MVKKTFFISGFLGLNIADIWLLKMVVMVTLLTSILAQICIMRQEGSPLSPNPTVTKDNKLNKKTKHTEEIQ